MEYAELYRKRIRMLCQERNITINKLATMSGCEAIYFGQYYAQFNKKSQSKNLAQDRPGFQYDTGRIFGF